MIYFYSDVSIEHFFKDYINTYQYNYDNIKHINDPDILIKLIYLNNINNIFIINFLSSQNILNIKSISKIYILNTEQLSKIE